MSDFLVEVMPGRELVYRTPLSLRAAIRSGEITPDSRIFHRATSSWISITEHPEYRRVQEEHIPAAWLQPEPLPEPVLLKPAPTQSLLRRKLAGLSDVIRRERAIAESFVFHGYRRAASGWASLKRRRATPGEKAASPRKPAPVQPAQPSPSTPPDPPPSGPSRDRWTFFP